MIFLPLSGVEARFHQSSWKHLETKWYYITSNWCIYIKCQHMTSEDWTCTWPKPSSTKPNPSFRQHFHESRSMGWCVISDIEPIFAGDSSDTIKERTPYSKSKTPFRSGKIMEVNGRASVLSSSKMLEYSWRDSRPRPVGNMGCWGGHTKRVNWHCLFACSNRGGQCNWIIAQKKRRFHAPTQHPNLLAGTQSPCKTSRTGGMFPVQDVFFAPVGPITSLWADLRRFSKQEIRFLSANAVDTCSHPAYILPYPTYTSRKHKETILLMQIWNHWLSWLLRPPDSKAGKVPWWTWNHRLAEPHATSRAGQRRTSQACTVTTGGCKPFAGH